MTDRDRVIDFCTEKHLLDIGDSVLVGFSGGADSVCLLFMLWELRERFDLKIYALHVNHGIRGEEARRDAEFCRDLCESRGIPFEAVYADIPALAKRDGLGLEEEGRKFRYECFEEKAKKYGCNRIAVAHHMNDRAETMMFQLIRGSRLKGLAGIDEKNGNIIRPLMCLSREEIEECLKENGLDHVTDSTNLENDYTRNRIRNMILPALEELRPRAVRHIAQSAEYLSRVSDFMEKLEEAALKDCELPGCTESIRILDIAKLRNLDPLISEAVIYKSICIAAGRKKDIGEINVQCAADLLTKQTGRVADLKYGLIAKRVYDSLVICSGSLENAVDIKNGNCNNRLCTETYHVKRGSAAEFVKAHGGLENDGSSRFFDLDRLSEHFNDPAPPIVIREAESADMMAVYPDGRRKKVFDILKDEKIDAKARKKTLVAAVGNEVLLIPGVRSAEICRVDEKTENILYAEILRRNDNG